MPNKNKTDRIYIRISKDVKDYITEAAAYHQCTMTDFVINQCMRQEYIVVDWKNIDEVMRLMANIANNINQIARILNFANKNHEVITEGKEKEIQDSFNEVKKLINEIKDPVHENIAKLFEICSNKKIREIPLPDDYNENR